MSGKLILFTNTYPYGAGETFLHEELPFVAARFSEVVIYPLYIPKTPYPYSSVRSLPDNVVVREALLPFDHKDKIRLLIKGLFNFAPVSFAFKELFSRRVLCSSRNLWIFFSYLLLLRAVLGNRKRMKEVKRELFGLDGNLSGEKNGKAVAYFYWGDKSALMIPFLKKWYARAKNRDNGIDLPEFVVRFHGSDLYEYAKGYLPFRKMLYSAVDYAVTISQSGAEYIKANYAGALPKHICVYRLGSCNPFEEIAHNNGKSFKIISCSNVIELKRVNLIAEALREFGKDLDLVLELAEQGLEEVHWVHIGNGPLLDEIKRECNGLPSYIKTEFKGAMPHNEVLEYYSKASANLFVNVSRSEGVPVSIMEALSFGMPVAATDVGGVKEIINESAGTLLPANVTASELKKVFVHYMQLSAAESQKMRSNAIAEWQKSWNAEINYSKFADFISSLSRQ